MEATTNPERGRLTNKTLAENTLDTIARTGQGTVIKDPKTGTLYISKYLWYKPKYAFRAAPTNGWVACDHALAYGPNGIRFVFGDIPTNAGDVLVIGK